MKKLITFLLLSLPLFLIKAYAQSDAIDAFKKTKKEMVLDTITLRQRISEVREKIQRRISHDEKQKDDTKFLLSNLEGKIKNENQKKILTIALIRFAKNRHYYDGNWDINDLEEDENYLTYSEENIAILIKGNKEAEKIKKKINKGTIPVELKSFIGRRQVFSARELTPESAERILKKLEQNLDRLSEYARIKDKRYEMEKNNLIETFDDLYSNLLGEVPATTKTLMVVEGDADRMKNYVNDNGVKRPNKNSWLWKYINDEYGWGREMKILLHKGWEWASDQDRMKEVDLSYPIQINYKMSDEHPEYAIKDNCVFDKQGKLIRVLQCYGGNINEAKRIIYLQDYNANKYDIKSKPSKTQNEVKRALGFDAKETAAEKEINDEIEKQLNNYIRADEKMKSANTRSGYRKAEKEREIAGTKGGLLLLGSIIDNEGLRFIEQLEKDHKQDFKVGYYIERIDNTTFKIKYVNIDNNGVSYTLKVSFYQDKPFSVSSKTTILAKDEEPLKIEDFFDPDVQHSNNRDLYYMRT